MTAALILTGKIFGRLTVISRNGSDKKGGARWLCQCSCPKKTLTNVSSSDLTAGKAKSCGCQRIDTLLKLNSKDLTGCKFGKLTVIRRFASSKRRQAKWECYCECSKDKVIVVRGCSLTSGHGTSCGCLKKEISRYEMISRRKFSEEVIKYIRSSEKDLKTLASEARVSENAIRQIRNMRFYKDIENDTNCAIEKDHAA